MRPILLLAALGLAGCAASNTASAPTGSPTLSNSGAGPQPGASAGASTQGGVLGTGTADSPAGAK